MWLFAILWTIKILCNAHLCIYNVVLTMCLTHKVPQNLPNSLLKFFNLEEMILNTGSNPFIWKYLVSMDYIIKYLMFIHIMAKLNLSLRELSLLFDDLKQNCNLLISSQQHVDLHCIINLNLSTAIIRLSLLQLVRENLALQPKHFPSANR